ncbi:MAG TPA: VWA domain-containing protein [Chromatiales bacterium]|nr:VWA domain-containing protein [Chromatiales bacterium]
MPETGFHFAQPLWLWGLLAAIPVAIWLARSSAQASKGRISLYADPHLLPYLTGVRELPSKERWRRFLRWMMLWTLGILAMAGPRWDYTDARLFKPGSSLVILLDISRSLEVTDVQPSRLARAKQEVHDLISQNRQLRIGLIAFASVAHIVSPVTEDTQSIRTALPALSTRLTRLQGSRVAEALVRAEQLLMGQPEGSPRTILLISDGDFDEPGLEEQVKQLADKGIRLQTLGIGTVGGGAVPGINDGRGVPVISHLNAPLLERLAEAGRGEHIEADFRDDDTQVILEAAAENTAPLPKEGETTQIWNERFYLLLIPVLLLLLSEFRRHAARKPS